MEKPLVTPATSWFAWILVGAWVWVPLTTSCAKAKLWDRLDGRVDSDRLLCLLDSDLLQLLPAGLYQHIVPVTVC